MFKNLALGSADADDSFGGRQGWEQLKGRQAGKESGVTFYTGIAGFDRK